MARTRHVARPNSKYPVANGDLDARGCRFEPCSNIGGSSKPIPVCARRFASDAGSFALTTSSSHGQPHYLPRRLVRRTPTQKIWPAPRQTHGCTTSAPSYDLARSALLPGSPHVLASSVEARVSSTKMVGPRGGGRGGGSKPSGLRNSQTHSDDEGTSKVCSSLRIFGRDSNRSSRRRRTGANGAEASTARTKRGMLSAARQRNRERKVGCYNPSPHHQDR